MRRYRSNFEPGTTQWAVRRAQWAALGLSPEDMEKPKVAIINSSSELSICFSHLDPLVDVVKKAVRDAGGIAFEVKTTAPSDFITGAGKGGRYLMPARDLVVNDIEVSVEGAQLDGMVCLSSCDKTAPAHLMAAARLNIPTLLVPCGYQACGCLDGQPVDIEDVFESIGKLRTHEFTLEHVTQMSDIAVQSPGVCRGMGTANTMHIMAEALGMTLPGAAPIFAQSEKLLSHASASGQQIVEMINNNRRPRDVLTQAAFYNAAAVGLAISGSVNMLRHLQAVAAEGNIDVDVYRMFDSLADEIPLLCAVKPNGDMPIDALEQAGGARAVMKNLSSKLKQDCLTVNGRTVGENIAAAPPSGAAIRTLDKPVTDRPSLIILKGSLAPESAIMKVGSLDKATRFHGPARVFETQDAALDALAQNRIQAGDVVVLRGLGARGGPGVASASWFVAALSGSGLGAEVAVVTDGQLSGLNRGYVVGQVLPEATDGGPIGLVREGDCITIDLERRCVDLDVSAGRLKEREIPAPAFVDTRGWLDIYRSCVTPLSKGATLRPRTLD